MNRIILFFFVTFCFWAPSSIAKTPNVVLIFTDDQGYADVGCFGAKGYKTPHLDQLAQEGIKFTDFYVTSSVCSASRSALLTGCHNARVDINGAFTPNAHKRRHRGLNLKETTIAEMLKKKEYTTACIGKWHLGDYVEFLPTRHGFDSYYGLPYSNDMWRFHPTDSERYSLPLPLLENETVIDRDVTPEDQKQLTKNYTAKALEFIESNKDKPFFLYLAHSMPHVPLFTSPEFEGSSEQGRYGDVIQEIDWSVGQVLNMLEKHDLEEHTLVIFSSDNGPWLSYGDHGGSAAPFREGKATSWEGGVRVPAIMKWKGVIPAGTSTSVPCSTIDVFPTIADITDSQLPDLPIDGHSLLQLLKKPDILPSFSERALYFNFVGNLQSMRRGKWKLILPHTYRSVEGLDSATGGFPVEYKNIEITEPELYNLVQDPGEQKNLAQSEPEILQELLEQAETWSDQFGDKTKKIKGTEVRSRGVISR